MLDMSHSENGSLATVREHDVQGETGHRAEESGNVPSEGTLLQVSFHAKEPSISHKSPAPQPQWVFIKLDLSNVTYVGIRREEGTMCVSNRSIQIRCDGHYLFFLKGTVHLQQSNDSLRLRVKKSQDQHKEYFLDVLCSARKQTVVRQDMVSELRAQDEISLEANQSASRQDLSLVLIMLTPHSYCFPEKS